MERLNYFNPYLSKTSSHEDQLTRAYLVLLKHSFHAFCLFYDYCQSRHEIDPAREELRLPLHALLADQWEINTQLINPVIGTDWLMSVLITDEDLFNKHQEVAGADRNARYDGVITFGSQLTLVIEVKPRNAHVWSAQLNPAREGLSQETRVYRNASCLEWKEIIQHLNQVKELQSISGQEKMMIEDFLSFIDEHFAFLNPYDRFHLCKGHHELLQRRIHNLLQSLVLREDSVRYHYGWGFYIETPYKEIKEIGLILHREENLKSWRIELSLYFGDTQSQARSFYTLSPRVSHLSEDWDVYANFHVAFRSSNLVWFKTPMDIEQYIAFWSAHIDAIKQQRRDQVSDYVDWLKQENIIDLNEETAGRLDEKFYDTAMQTLNICPGFGAVYTFTQQEAEELDRGNQLAALLLAAMKEGLGIIHQDGREFLKPSIEKKPR